MDDETLCTMNMFISETKLLIDTVSILLRPSTVFKYM